MACTVNLLLLRPVAFRGTVSPQRFCQQDFDFSEVVGTESSLRSNGAEICVSSGSSSSSRSLPEHAVCRAMTYCICRTNIVLQQCQMHNRHKTCTDLCKSMQVPSATTVGNPQLHPLGSMPLTTSSQPSVSQPTRGESQSAMPAQQQQQPLQHQVRTPILGSAASGACWNLAAPSEQQHHHQQFFRRLHKPCLYWATQALDLLNSATVWRTSPSHAVSCQEASGLGVCSTAVSSRAKDASKR